MGKVYLVGAGPGDIDLITIKGLNLIKKADVIIYDFLINSSLLSYAKKGVELICAGKSSNYHSMDQNLINRLLVEKSDNHAMVVRLKSGDPFIFGRGVEEAMYLAEHNIPYEIVPGVTSAIAVPETCGIPLTHRDYASSLAIITGHRKDDHEIKPVNADTLVFLMAVENLESITKRLITEGKSKDIPCILIERGCSVKKRLVEGNLGNICEYAFKEKICPPAVFVVGEVVKLRGRLNLY